MGRPYPHEPLMDQNDMEVDRYRGSQGSEKKVNGNDVRKL